MNKIRNLLLLVIFMAQALRSGPLHDAAKEGRLDAVKTLLEDRVEVDARDDINWTPLMWAAWKNHLAVVQELLRANAQVNARESTGQTALMPAVQFGHLSIVQELLRAGADINAMTDEDQTVLLVADSHGHTDIIRTIRECSIETQVFVTNRRDRKILDGNKRGSYKRDFRAHKKEEQVGPEIKKSIFERIFNGYASRSEGNELSF